jgi:DNA-binding NarL/FixJ family response regulator
MSRYRIILADDHPLFRQGLRRIVEDVADLEVIGEAGDGIELLALLGMVRADMVILDVSMPNLSGIEAVREIRKQCSDLKVLILSTYKEYLNQALDAGVDGYLLKEDADGQLFAAIEHIRQNRRYISPRLSEKPLGAPMTGRERMVLGLIAGSKSNREIADMLFISVRTVEAHRASILKKLRLKNTADLVRYALEHGYA